ncbi:MULTISPECIES: hypothetical protein [unclassified Leucobacter]|uniref:nucleotide-binding domain-containing protein n=1 Tax=unclassified Leucobacter TaxID=2621730 RepID=UPI0019D2FDB9|nr:hypothetical protein [Leucobacter sp. CX169]
MPSSDTVKASREVYAFDDSEQFIEDRYPVDIRYALTFDCKVSQDGFRTHWLREMIRSKLPLLTSKSLDFSVIECEVPKPYELKWKVLNQGDEAERRNCIRGQIIPGSKSNGHHEATQFRGEHYVECYAIKDGVVVARGRVEVPITTA